MPAPIHPSRAPELRLRLKRTGPYAVVAGMIAVALLAPLCVSTLGQEEADSEQVKPAKAESAIAAPAETGPAKTMTLKKLKDVEVQEYPWGWIRWTMNAQLDPSSKMTFGVVYIKPNQTNTLHLHPKADEILHVVEGSCEHRMGDKWVKMKVGDTIRIPHGVHHNARTLDEPCRVVVVYDTGQRKMVPVDPAP